MMKEELEDLAGNRLRALENIEKNKRRPDGITRKSKLKNLLKEIWFGSSYYKSAQGILNMGSGRLIGKDHIGSVNAYHVMHIYWRHWKERSLLER
jgi:hypothetical protein